MRNNGSHSAAALLPGRLAGVCCGLVLGLTLTVPVAQGYAVPAWESPADSVPDHAAPAARFAREETGAFPGRAALLPECGVSGAFYQRRTGDFRDNQLPEQENRYGVRSYGLRRAGKFRLEGSFSYRRVLADSVPWLLAGERSSMPYYLAVPKKGNWQRDLLDLGLNAVRPLAGDRLQLAAGVQYGLQKHARSNDTRMSTSRYYLDVALQLGYALSPGHRIGLMGHVWWGDVKASGRNYNRQHDSFGETAYNIHTMLGWGSFDKLSRRRFAVTETGRGAGISYYGQAGRVKLVNELSYGRSGTRFTRIGTEGGQRIEERVGTYTLETWANRSYLRAPAGRMLHQASAVLSLENGRDYNELYAGQNYVYRARRARVNYLLSLDPDRRFSAGGSVEWSSRSRLDRNASQEMDRRNLEAGLCAEVAIPDKSWQYLAGGALTFRANLDKNFVPGTGGLNVVTEGVLYPEFLYETSNFTAPSLRAGVRKQWAGLRAELILDYSVIMAGKAPGLIGEAALVPAGRRQAMGIELNFYH